MKYTCLLFFLFVHALLPGQSDNAKTLIKKIRWQETITDTGKSFYMENDTAGNPLFFRNRGMNGPVMLSAKEYDSLNRESRSVLAHGGLGFYLSETVYENRMIKIYNYGSEEERPKTSDSLLRLIDTREAFLQHPAVLDLAKKEKHLSQIKLLDSMNNVLAELYISDTGDTTSINTYRYDSN